MARGRMRRGGEYAQVWPGYVDVLSTLLLVVTFLMSIFMLAQYFASQEASGKDTALKKLTLQITELTNLLALEKGKGKSAEDELAALQASLAALKEENTKLSGSALSGDEVAKSAQARIAGLSADLENQKNISNEALAKVDLLNQQLLALRRQIAALNDPQVGVRAAGEERPHRLLAVERIEAPADEVDRLRAGGVLAGTDRREEEQAGDEPAQR